jgi:hypothetical protein
MVPNPYPHHPQTCAINRIAGLFSLVVGTMSLITQLLLYVWLEESDSVRITLTFISLFAVLPLLHLVPRPQGSGKIAPQGVINS